MLYINYLQVWSLLGGCIPGSNRSCIRIQSRWRRARKLSLEMVHVFLLYIYVYSHETYTSMRFSVKLCTERLMINCNYCALRTRCSPILICGCGHGCGNPVDSHTCLNSWFLTTIMHRYQHFATRHGLADDRCIVFANQVKHMRGRPRDVQLPDQMGGVQMVYTNTQVLGGLRTITPTLYRARLVRQCLCIWMMDYGKKHYTIKNKSTMYLAAKLITQM